MFYEKTTTILDRDYFRLKDRVTALFYYPEEGKEESSPTKFERVVVGTITEVTELTLVITDDRGESCLVYAKAIEGYPGSRATPDQIRVKIKNITKENE